MKAIGKVLCISLGVALGLTGCNMAPKYSRPKAPVPAVWPARLPEQQAEAPAPKATDVRWQDFFGNEKLRQVIALALENNRDLRVAALNVERAQAQYRVQRAQLYPALNVGASAQGNRVPANLSTTGKDYTNKQYEFGVITSSWEADLWGRLRNLKQQALEQYFATQEARSATQISLVAAVAGSYLSLAADRESLRLAKATLKSQQDSYEMVLRKREMGIASDLDLRQAESQVRAAQVDIARYTGQVALDENALNLLVGAPVPANLLAENLGQDEMLKDVSAGLPSDVLLRRPDVLSAEHRLKGANANIGAARAAFFPQMTMTAAGGLLSSSLGDLFKGSAGTWNFAPQIIQPIFDAGARRANLKISQVDRDTAVATYEATIQTAFREVSDSLALREWLKQQQDAQQALVNTLDATYRLSEARYQAGIDSYLSVLVAQRSLYSGQQALVSLRLARLGNLVTLYKVLGGGV